MTSRTRARRRLLRWDRWLAHYPPTIKATPACVRAYEAANQVPYDPFSGGQCYCGGCVGMGPCEHEPREPADDWDEICRCAEVCECGQDYSPEDDLIGWPVETIVPVGGVL